MDLQGKNVLLSGGNSGIGLEAAYTFAKWGAKVILACRDPPPHETHPEKAIELMLEKSEGEIKREQLEWWEVDYSSLDSVEALGKRWMDSGMVLDYLCNNAGLSSLKHITTKDGYELTSEFR
jgi:NAD(P)-dependent dehydrogenase (short-subunit alcohol dehydrogenase family)